MLQLNINLQEIVNQAKSWINSKIRATNDGAKKSLNQAASIVNEEIKASIREENAIASGALLQSVTIGSMKASTEGYEMTVGSSSPYASFVEEGRRAGTKAPPVDVIAEWMTQKGLETDSSAAYLIARKIGRDGIPAKHVFEKGVQNAERKLDAALNATMDESLRKN